METPAESSKLAREHFEQGVSFLQKGDLETAALHFRSSLELRPELAEAHFNLGLVILQTKGPSPARPYLEECLRLRPEMTQASNLLARCLLALNLPDEALQQLERSSTLCPQNPDTLNSLGRCLLALNRAGEAQTCFEKALQMNPGHPDLLCNLGAALQAQSRTRHAIQTYESILALRPNHHQARLNLAISLLSEGRLAEAWPHFEARKVLGLAGSNRPFSGLEWTGKEPLQGRSLLLHAEQGMGDTLQFVRYLPLLREAGARLHLEVQSPLVPLLRRLPFLASCNAVGDQLPVTDFHCALASLPGRFASGLEDLPKPNPGLMPDPEHIRFMATRLPRGGDHPRVGLVWSGSHRHPHDRQRSIPLATLMDGLDGLSLQLFSLQTDITPEDQKHLPSLPLIQPLGGELHDFHDSAAMLENMDLLICVDTAFAHLAGILGKPAFVLLAQPSDWRWFLRRGDSPWYPSLRLFRQQKPGDWVAPLEELRKAFSQAFAQG